MERLLTFWKNGFSLDEGELKSYDDPANREFLEAIQKGVAPLQFLNVKPGERVDLKVAHKLDQDFIAPPKKLTPFAGQGHRLGAIVSSGSSSVSNQASSVVASEITIDPTLPTTSIQIRFSDGTRSIFKCNHSHTIGDLRSFIKQSKLNSDDRPFIIQTMHPVVTLEKNNQTVKEAGLLNSVVLQRFLN